MIMTHDLIEKTASCRICGAGIGSPCTRRGILRKRNHHERQIDAQKIISGKTPKAAKKKFPVQKCTKVPDDFYDSWEWKSARFVALKRHGRRCQCCGWSPADGSGNYLVVDHIKPLRLFPQLALDPDNHQVLCNDCNKGKSFRHTDDFRPKD